jgi:hypothetical protein
MWEIFSILSALIINFYSPKINNSVNNDAELIRSFPFQYYEGEILTDDQVKYRLRIIYINYLMFITVSFSSFSVLGPIIQIGLPLPVSPVLLERLMQQENFYSQIFFLPV